MGAHKHFRKISFFRKPMKTLTAADLKHCCHSKQAANLNNVVIPSTRSNPNNVVIPSRRSLAGRNLLSPEPGTCFIHMHNREGHGLQPCRFRRAFRF